MEDYAESQAEVQAALMGVTLLAVAGPAIQSFL